MMHRIPQRLLLALGCLGIVAQLSAQSLTITTIAGSPVQAGSADGAGASARFSRVGGIAIDTSGNLILTDSNNHTIRKITPAGVVTTFAGLAGSAGYVDATGPNARFELPQALVQDSSGNLYVGQGTRVRKITPAGAVTTLVAQPGLAGSASDGRSTSAFNRDPVFGFNGVTALAMDSARSLYVGEFYSIRKIAFDSREYFFAGTQMMQGTTEGPPGTGRFGIVAGMAMDPAGNVFVADSINHAIRKVTPQGVISTLAGALRQEGYFDGPAAAARFSFPMCVALDRDGNLFVGDSGNHAIRKISPAGVVSTVAGNPSMASAPMDGVGANATFSGPSALAFDGAGTLYIGDTTSLRKATPAPVPAKVIVSPKDQSAPAGQSATFAVQANGNPAPSYQWQRQAAAATAFANLFNDGIYSGTTTPILVVNRLATGMTGDQFRCVVSNALGTDASRAAALNVEPPVVVVPLRVATFVGRAGTNAGGDDGTGSAARFTAPMGLALDKDGNLFVADTFGSRIRKVTPAGVVTTIAGSGVLGSADGTGRAAQFGQPGGIAVDKAGNLYVADGWNSNIRKITPAGAVTTFAGKAGERNYVNGPGNVARFHAPNSIAIDRAGNLIVSDTIWLRRITPEGVVSGIDFHFGRENDDAPLTNIGPLVLDAADNIYVTCGETVRKVTPAGFVTTVAGQHVTPGSADGRALNARFTDLRGIALDAAGNLYVADGGGHTLRKISASGMVTTVGGVAPTTANADSSGASDGIGSAARFKQPHGLVMDRTGSLYIADTLNNTIRRATPVDAATRGESVAFSVLNATSPNVTYQWMKDSRDVAGATGAQFTIPAATPADIGVYSVKVVVDSSVSESETVALSVDGVAPPPPAPKVEPPTVTPPPNVTPPVVTPPAAPVPASRIVNLSIRAALSQAAPNLIVGFVTGGDPMPLLVRGVGPSLAQFAVTAPVSDPRIVVYAGSTVAASNETWANLADIAATGARLGAFPLAANSRDAAVLSMFNGGGFTVQCASVAGRNGVVLVEVYDASSGASGPNRRLRNVSARSRVGSDDAVMIAGFSIVGDAPRTLLVRAIGPTLRVFGVADAISDPQARLVAAQDGRTIATNDNWGGAITLARAFASVGAFPLAAESSDAAFVATLPPGTYSVVVSGASASTTGECLVEIYELEEP